MSGKPTSYESEFLKSIMSQTTQNVGVLSVLTPSEDIVRVCTISSFNTYSISGDGENYALLCLSANSLTGKYFKERKVASFHYLPSSAKSIAEECTTAQEFNLNGGDWALFNESVRFTNSKFTLDLDLIEVIVSHEANIFLSRVIRATENHTDEAILKYHCRNYV